MYRRVMIVSVQEDGSATVLPVINDECSKCAGGCAKQGSPFSVKNPQNLAVRTGSIAAVSTPKSKQALEGILSLVVPFFCAIGGYFAAVPFAKSLGLPSGDGARAIGVLLFLALSSAIVLFINRRIPEFSKPEIIEILQS
ncbi:MAG: SoxR reducing system RseC family protein [Treponema sp.]|nr:SoxR reducing system RseC family protein [Treponema sp.]